MLGTAGISTAKGRASRIGPLGRPAASIERRYTAAPTDLPQTDLLCDKRALGAAIVSAMHTYREYVPGDGGPHQQVSRTTFRGDFLTSVNTHDLQVRLSL